MTQGYYSPEMLPGRMDRDRPDINRPGSATRAGSLSAINSRYYSLKQNSNLLQLDSQLRAFIENDVPSLLAIAQAADRLRFYSQGGNAEGYRRSIDEVIGAVRRAS